MLEFTKNETSASIPISNAYINNICSPGWEPYFMFLAVEVKCSVKYTWSTNMRMILSYFSESSREYKGISEWRLKYSNKQSEDWSICIAWSPYPVFRFAHWKLTVSSYKNWFWVIKWFHLTFHTTHQTSARVNLHRLWYFTGSQKFFWEWYDFDVIATLLKEYVSYTFNANNSPGDFIFWNLVFFKLHNSL